MNEVAAFQAHPRPSRWESISAVDGRHSNKWSSRDDSNWDIQKRWKATRQLFYRLHFRVFAFHHRRRHLASRFLRELRLNMVEQNHCIAVARGPASLRYVEKANKNSKAPDSVSNHWKFKPCHMTASTSEDAGTCSTQDQQARKPILIVSVRLSADSVPGGHSICKQAQVLTEEWTNECK